MAHLRSRRSARGDPGRDCARAPLKEGSHSDKALCRQPDVRRNLRRPTRAVRGSGRGRERDRPDRSGDGPVPRIRIRGALDSRASGGGHREAQRLRVERSRTTRRRSDRAPRNRAVLSAGRPWAWGAELSSAPEGEQEEPARTKAELPIGSAALKADLDRSNRGRMRRSPSKKRVPGTKPRPWSP